jgi:hypothetical protein
MPKYTPFEIHLTVGYSPEKQISHFVDLCLANAAKPLLIELSSGEQVSQPMFNKIVYKKNLKEALTTATEYARLLDSNAFQVKRLKIEIPSDYVDKIQNDEQDIFKSYFEWHGKTEFNRAEQLNELCLRHHVHLSLNSLKDAVSTRFITLREFGAKSVFEQRIKRLLNDLKKGGWRILKQQSEYCLYDDNIFLDKGWLPQ